MVVLDHGALAAVQHNVVRRQVFAEIRHPAVNADVEAAGFDDLVLEPVVGFRIGQVNNTAVELAEIDQIDAAVAAAGEDAGLQTLPVELAALHEVGIDIPEEFDPSGVQLFDFAREIRIHLGVEVPVPLQALAEGGDAFSAPVLAPDAGNLDVVLQSLLQKTEGTLVSTLDTDDETVVDPVGELGLAAEEGGLLLQQGEKALRSFDADGGGNLPELQLMEILMTEIEIRIGRGVGVQVIMPAGDIGGLRKVRVVIITAGLVLHIGAPGHISGLVAADAGLACPEREVAAAQIEVGHLLTAAPAALVLLCRDAEPDPVDLRVSLRERQDRTVAIQRYTETEILAVIDDGAVRLLRERSDRKRTPLGHIVFNFEVAAVHVDALLTAADVEHRKVIGRAQKCPTLLFQLPAGKTVM